MAEFRGRRGGAERRGSKKGGKLWRGGHHQSAGQSRPLRWALGVEPVSSAMGSEAGRTTRERALRTCRPAPPTANPAR